MSEPILPTSNLLTDTDIDMFVRQNAAYELGIALKGYRSTIERLQRDLELASGSYSMMARNSQQHAADAGRYLAEIKRLRAVLQDIGDSNECPELPAIARAGLSGDLSAPETKARPSNWPPVGTRDGDGVWQEDGWRPDCLEKGPELCPHGAVLAENTCGPCSKGEPNRPAQKASTPQKYSPVSEEEANRRLAEAMGLSKGAP